MLRIFIVWLALATSGSVANAVVLALPACVHWTQEFWFTDVMPTAKVTGKKGQRLYLYRQNPQLCALDKLLRCGSARYLVTDDEVVLGHQCGRWAHVEFRSRGASRFEGWVDLSRLRIAPLDVAVLTAQDKEHRKLTWSPLDVAIFDGDLDAIRGLLHSDEDIGEALAKAVGSSRSDVALELLRSGARPTQSAEPCQIVVDAVRGDVRVLRALLDVGAAVNCFVDSQQMSPLKMLATTNRAARVMWPPMAHFLGAGVEDPNPTFQVLLEHGADLNILDVRGGTPLRATLEHNNVDIARLLLSAGADPDNYIGDSTSIGERLGNTVLMEAVLRYPLRLDTSLVRVLLDHGANVDFRNQLRYDELCDMTRRGECTFRGQTVLTRAASDGHYAVVSILLEHGADPTLCRTDGKAPAEIARENGHPAVAKLIDKYTTRR